jgi:transposase
MHKLAIQDMESVGRRLKSGKVSDEFWKRVEPLIPKRTVEPTGKKRLRKTWQRTHAEAREAGVWSYRVRAARGCLWKAVPNEQFGRASAIHKRFLESEAAGLYAKLRQQDRRSTTTWKGSPGSGSA